MTNTKDEILKIFIEKKLFAKDISSLAKILGYTSRGGGRQGLYNAYNKVALNGQIEALWKRFEKIGYPDHFLFNLGKAYFDYSKLKRILGKDEIFEWLLKCWNEESLDMSKFVSSKKEKIQNIHLSDSHEFLSVLLAYSFLGRDSDLDFWKTDSKQMLDNFIKTIVSKYPEYGLLESYLNNNGDLLDSPAKFILFILSILNEIKNKRDSNLLKYWDKETLWMTENSLENGGIKFCIFIYFDIENYGGYSCISCYISPEKKYEVEIEGYLAFMDVLGSGQFGVLYKNINERIIFRYLIDKERKSLKLLSTEPITLHLIEIKKNSNNMYSEGWMHEIDKFMNDTNVRKIIDDKLKEFSLHFWEQAPNDSIVKVQKVISDGTSLYIKTDGSDSCNWYKVDVIEFGWIKDIKEIGEVKILEKEGRQFFHWKNHLYYLYLDECIILSEEKVIKELLK